MQKSEIEKIIKQNSLFNFLAEEEFEWVKKEILPKLEIVDYKLGDEIISANASSSSFYIIAAGKVRILDTSKGKNITLAILNQGNSFGEHCLLSLNPSPITIRASNNLTLLKLKAVDFESLFKKIPILKNKLNSSIQQQQEFQFFRTLNIFSDLKLPEAYKYQQDIELIEVKAGECIFKEGQTADAAYIVRSGNIRLVKQNSNNRILAILRQGDICGETALLFEENIYDNSAIATKDTVVF
ncbi:MAG: cyclic nucleotide-binding domain-containing protein [Rivularia sp. ALOHA_DT_140]|nr:cyclic nucleotide-binding domain-containing protein [Rivularia sp. ALOHA_DT_140]